MTGLHRLYQASPEEFCAELDKALAHIKQIDARIAENSARTEAMAALQEEFLRIGLSRHLTTEAPTSWTYNARLPNRYFNDAVFLPETHGTAFKRWVRKERRLCAKLAFSRTFQYDFSVVVADFVSPEAEQSFSLRVDGHEYPWITINARLFKTIILEAPESSVLDFELFVDPGTVPGDKDVSFSFISIEIIRRA